MAWQDTEAEVVKVVADRLRGPAGAADAAYVIETKPHGTEINTP